MKWNFLYQITAASKTPDNGANAPQILCLSVCLSVLSSTEIIERIANKIPGYATGLRGLFYF